MQQLEILDSRRVDLSGPFEDGEAIRIFPTTKRVEVCNQKMSEKLERSTEFYSLNAGDTSTELKTYGQKPKDAFIPVIQTEQEGYLAQ